MIVKVGENTYIHSSVVSYGRNELGSRCVILEDVILGHPTSDMLVDMREKKKFITKCDTYSSHRVLTRLGRAGAVHPGGGQGSVSCARHICPHPSRALGHLGSCTRALRTTW